MSYYQKDDIFGKLIAHENNWLSGWIAGERQPTLVAYDRAVAAAERRGGYGPLPGAGRRRWWGSGAVVGGEAGLSSAGSRARRRWGSDDPLGQEAPGTPMSGSVSQGQEETRKPYREWDTSLLLPGQAPSKTENAAETQRQGRGIPQHADEWVAFGIKGETVHEYNKRVIARSSHQQGGSAGDELQARPIRSA